MNRKEHWENVFKTKSLNEVSWFEPIPKTSLSFIEIANLSKSDKIIDIGGGDSFLVDHLLKLGYTNITVLDISEAAIERAKKRLKNQTDDVTWIVSDVLDFVPTEKYHFWHDRASFHFLIDEFQIKKYQQLVQQNIEKNGNLVIGTFSENGPKKCSGLEINQYSEKSMEDLFNVSFSKQKCINKSHTTPFDTNQNFTFCWFKRL
ncbi:class I SAM-dependent methyltransferase [Winogradskyella sp. HB-48]|uniref:class I SAM-dependent methyltransferase n=1 Tax=Winogradskyella sp. HB-48 TaxID=3416808 RepID=UPI003CECD921